MSSSASTPATTPHHWLALTGADQQTVAALAALAEQHAATPARVVRAERGLATCLTPDGTVRAAPAPGTPAAAVGDWVAVAGDAVVAVLPRRSAFVRAASTRRTQAQVLAVNLDTVLVCAALSSASRLTRIERFLALSWESGAVPVVVLTKSDLVAPDEVAGRVAEAGRAAPGAEVVAVSTATGEGLDRVGAHVGPGRTVAVLGPSGAGKSSLVNALAGTEVLAVGDTRDADGKGRHTSVRRELVLLPAGGAVTDTPGLRGLALWNADEGLDKAFADVADLAADCRFGDCSHRTEPGCAVQAAVEAGVLDARRVASHDKLGRELARLAARQDGRLRAERSAELRRFSRSLKDQPHR